MSEIRDLSFEERLGLLVEREATERASRRLTSRLRKAKLREQAAIEDVDWRARRGLDKRQILTLASCQWIADHLNVLITGKAGVGKTFLACALAHKACREGYTALYLRVPRLFRDLAIARGDGSYEKLLKSYAAPMSWSSTTGDWPRSARRSAETCSRSSRIATACARPWSPASCRSRAGTTRSGTRLWPTASSIGSSTVPMRSRWRASPCVESGPTLQEGHRGWRPPKVRRSEPEGATISTVPWPRCQLPATEGHGSCRRLMEIAPRFPQPTCKTLPPDHPPRVSHSSHHPDDETMTV